VMMASLRPTHHEDFVDASIRQFCATAKARLQACSDFDMNRHFLVDHIGRVTYNRYHVKIAGSIPVRTESRESKLPFRIESNIPAIRSNSCQKAALAAMRSTVSDMSTAENTPVSLQVTRYAEASYPPCRLCCTGAIQSDAAVRQLTEGKRLTPWACERDKRPLN
jgi:hypothetical protein